MKVGTFVGISARTTPSHLTPGAVWRFLLAAIALVASPALSSAQIENVKPFFVTVERDNAALQCRFGAVAYPVKVLKAGDVLKVDGQSQSIYRVEYPAGMSALARVEEAKLDEGGKTVMLTKPSRLMAANAEGGVSWWHLLDKELEAGTTFAHQKTVKGPDGKDAGYLVPAPVGSKAYIRREYVRQATQEEIDRHLGKSEAPETEAGPGAEPKPAVPEPAKAEAPKPAATEPGTVTPATQPEDAPGVTTIVVKPRPEDATTAPGGVTPSQPGETPAPSAAGEQKPDEGPRPAARKPVDVATLNRLYDDARKTMDHEELDAVIGEFQRSIDSLPQDDPYSQRLRAQLGMRVQALKLRADLQAALRRTSTSSDNLQAQTEQMKAELKRLESLRQYTVVGRLVASAVYDGRNLPLMYRVLSPEPTSTRTLAYVAPEANMHLVDKVGKLVGVVGEAKMDESLRVNIVVPVRVDLLGAVGATQPAPTPSPEPAPDRVGADQNK